MILISLVKCFGDNEFKELLRAGFLFSEKYYIQMIFFVTELAYFICKFCNFFFSSNGIIFTDSFQKVFHFSNENTFFFLMCFWWILVSTCFPVLMFLFKE